MKIKKEEALKRIKDPKFYLENFTKIKGKIPGSLIPFILNEAQKDLFNTLRHHNRIMILKARQIGFSSGVIGNFYHNTIMNPGTTTGIVGYNTTLTAELLDKVKTFYKSTPDELKPTLHFDSKYEMSFPKIDSKIIVLPSTECTGRGYTFSNLLATEIAFWENAEEKMIGLEASVPLTGKIVIESSPNGQGNLFHHMWMDDKNSYAKKKYGWQWGYTKEEIEMIRNSGVYRYNPLKFSQEYELNFLSSGRSVFDQYIIEKQRKNVLNVGDKTIDGGGNVYVVEEIDRLRIYKKPEKDGLYVVGGDSSEGVEGGDNSVAIIIDRKSGEEVAMFRGLIPPDRFGEKLNEWGRMYNNALMVVEANNHGLTVLTALKKLAYPNLYFRPTKIDTLSVSTSDRLGWKTTLFTRGFLIDDFAKAVREGGLIIHSKELLDEMAVFIYDNKGDMVAQRGFSDDCIFATAVALQGFKVMYHKSLDQVNYEDYLPKTYAY